MVKTALRADDLARADLLDGALGSAADPRLARADDFAANGPAGVGVERARSGDAELDVLGLERPGAELARSGDDIIGAVGLTGEASRARPGDLELDRLGRDIGDTEVA